MNDDGHFIDDPLMVVNAKLDFSNMGIHPINPDIKQCTLKDIIGEIPDWMKLLPNDWNGDTIRSKITLSASNLAIANKKFDLHGYISAKLKCALKYIMKKHGENEICMTSHFTATVDSYIEPGKTFFYFHVEYAKWE